MASAAKILGSSYSTVSRNIATLESQMGKKLFASVNRKLVLLEPGRELLARINDPYNEFTHLLDFVQALHRESDTIRILCSQMQASHVLRDIMPKLRVKFPKLIFEIRTYSPYMVMEYGSLFPRNCDKFDIIMIAVSSISSLNLNNWIATSSIKVKCKLYAHKKFANEVSKIRSMTDLLEIPAYQWRYESDTWNLNDDLTGEELSYDPLVIASSDTMRSIVEIMPLRFGIAQLEPTFIKTHNLSDILLPILPSVSGSIFEAHTMIKKSKPYFQHDKNVLEVVNYGKKVSDEYLNSLIFKNQSGE